MGAHLGRLWGLNGAWILGNADMKGSRAVPSLFEGSQCRCSVCLEVSYVAEGVERLPHRSQHPPFFDTVCAEKAARADLKVDPFL